MHDLDRHDDPQPGIGAVAPSLSPRSEMQVRGAQNIEIRNRHDQAITDFCW
jgi:hypothetical protein